MLNQGQRRVINIIASKAADDKRIGELISVNEMKQLACQWSSVQVRRNDEGEEDC